MRRSKFCVRHEASSVSLFMIVALLRESETDVTLQLTKMRELDDERDQILTHRQNQSIGGRTEKPAYDSLLIPLRSLQAQKKAFYVCSDKKKLVPYSIL